MTSKGFFDYLQRCYAKCEKKGSLRMKRFYHPFPIEFDKKDVPFLWQSSPIEIFGVAQTCTQSVSDQPLSCSFVSTHIFWKSL